MLIYVAEKMKLFDDYINGDDITKENMEKRYGKKQLIIMVNEIQAETWIGQNSKQCPHCNAPIEVLNLHNNIFM
jgi:uncharacterized protein with PIN domain